MALKSKRGLTKKEEETVNEMDSHVRTAGLSGDDKLALKRFGKLFNELTDKEKNALYYSENI
jgi:hypothetical protein